MSTSVVGAALTRTSRRRARTSWPPSLIAGIVILIPFVVIALFPGLFAPDDPNRIIAEPLLGPSGSHLLGTDEVGRDILSRVIYSARADVAISLGATALAFIAGTVIGMFVGYLGRWVDASAMRLVDVMLSFPTIVLALFLISVFGRGEFVEILAIALVMAPSMARLSRGMGVALRGRGYVEASRISRASTWHIMRRHLLPNAFSTLTVAASVLAASAVLIAASLSYLGVGTRPPTASWGNMLRAAYDVIYNAPLYGIAPGVCITLLAGAYMLIGTGLRVRHATGPVLSLGAPQSVPEP